MLNKKGQDVVLSTLGKWLILIAGFMVVVLVISLLFFRAEGVTKEQKIINMANFNKDICFYFLRDHRDFLRKTYYPACRTENTNNHFLPVG